MPNYSRILRWVFIFSLLISSGCAAGADQTVVTYPPCTPTFADPNPYRTPDDSSAFIIYQISRSTIPNTNVLSGNGTQRDAFNLLERQVRQWSDYKDVLVADNLVMRITITYISPEMIEAVVLNQVLYSNIPPIPDFSSQVKSVKDGIAKREELLFLVTVTVSEYRNKLLPDDKLVLDIPIKDLTLTNTSDLSVEPARDDHNLDDVIDLRNGPEHGYLGYPLAGEKDGSCQLVMDELDTTLTLHVPSLSVNNISRDAVTWDMNFNALVNMPAQDIDQDEITGLSPDLTGVMGNYFNPLETPPIPENGRSKDDQVYWDQYWDDMSRFIWYTLIN